MTKYALCVGINAYPSSPLQGCVNDALDWEAALEARGFEVQTLLDAMAARASILASLQVMLDGCDRDDIAVITFSGHGTRAPDTDGDEADGWDEMICAYPARRRTDMIADDDLYRLFSAADARGVRVVFISDSCHSGTMQRLAPALSSRVHPVAPQLVNLVDDDPEPYLRRARWLSPAEWMNPEDLRRAAPAWREPRGVSRRSALVLAACRPDQVAYDAFLDGRYRGAFTAAALTALADTDSAMNYRAWYRHLRTRLPSTDFDQVPQLDGSAAQSRWLLLAEQGRR